MDFIDEKNNLSLAFHYFLDHALESFLKLTLILGASYKSTQIKRIYGSALKILRNVAVHYLLSDSF